MQSTSKSTSRQHSRQPQQHLFNPQPLVIATMLLVAVFSGSALAQGDSPFAVENQKNKKFPAAEAARIYDAVCVVVAREVRPEHPPLLQPRFTLVLGAERDELVQNNDVAEIRLESWNRDKYAQAIVILAGREILKSKSISELSRRALAWTDSVVPMTELADAK